MKTKRFCILFLLSASLLTSMSLAREQGRPQGKVTAKLHPNDVYFASHGIVAIKFTETCADIKPTKGCPEPCHCITTGQPYDGVTFDGVNTMDDEGYVTVSAGRKNSKNVAVWFQNRVKTGVDKGFAFGLVDQNNFPDELNFALQGTLTLKYSDGSEIACENILIAQGSFTSKNNWWLGANRMNGGGASTVHVGKLTCKNNGKRALLNPIIVFSSKGVADSNHFNVSSLLSGENSEQ